MDLAQFIEPGDDQHVPFLRITAIQAHTQWTRESQPRYAGCEIAEHWNLEHDNYGQQSEECKLFIGSPLGMAGESARSTILRDFGPGGHSRRGIREAVASTRAKVCQNRLKPRLADR